MPNTSLNQQDQNTLLDKVQDLFQITLSEAVYWYESQRLDSFGYSTPKELVEQGKLKDLLMYINSLEAGACG